MNESQAAAVEARVREVAKKLPFGVWLPFDENANGRIVFACELLATIEVKEEEVLRELLRRLAIACRKLNKASWTYEKWRPLSAILDEVDKLLNR